jgi:adenylosuccinate lyase
MLHAISPIDGRYADKTADLSPYFSEYGLIKYRVFVEIEYFVALCDILPQLEAAQPHLQKMRDIDLNFSQAHAERIKAIERTTNHDVKAVEYFIKEEMEKVGLSEFQEFVHFGLTSQDINNTAIPLLLKEFLEDILLPKTLQLIDQIAVLSSTWAQVPMLAHTHGQPASPTRLGKEIMVFYSRLQKQYYDIAEATHTAKFGGATGNFNAHKVAFPAINWAEFADDFVDGLGLERQQTTTQIEHYDGMAALFHNQMRLNTILIDLCRDMWTYISMEYFKQKTKAGEVGSSAMPHKVNPIDFENAEGNLGLANAIFGHLADKLPVSRLQRDLTDSTVLRNIGVPFGHSIIALSSIEKGLSKLVLNAEKLHADLEKNWIVVAEGIQTILRREAYPQPYEALKDLTRGKTLVTQTDIHAFIDGLNVSDAIKTELKAITPHNYTGL